MQNRLQSKPRIEDRVYRQPRQQRQAFVSYNQANGYKPGTEQYLDPDKGLNDRQIVYRPPKYDLATSGPDAIPEAAPVPTSGKYVPPAMRARMQKQQHQEHGQHSHGQKPGMSRTWAEPVAATTSAPPVTIAAPLEHVVIPMTMTSLQHALDEVGVDEEDDDDDGGQYEPYRPLVSSNQPLLYVDESVELSGLALATAAFQDPSERPSYVIEVKPEELVAGVGLFQAPPVKAMQVPLVQPMMVPVPAQVAPITPNAVSQVQPIAEPKVQPKAAAAATARYCCGVQVTGKLCHSCGKRVK